MLSFSKFHGASNDFILVDDWSSSFDPSDAPRIAALCDRRTGIGADGLILLRPPRPAAPGAHVRMVFRNSDGSPAAMCGNGGRCLARFAFLSSRAPASMLLDTDAGVLAATVLPSGDVRLQLPPPSPIRL
ncbi:MAG: diaminopimelate epimerase, partial [Kiritimatiellae bacterium]|nr:diaminopimelate epimerase [Kiritimatiellia bacterium]